MIQLLNKQSKRTLDSTQTHKLSEKKSVHRTLDFCFTKEAFKENEKKKKPQAGRKDLQNMHLVKTSHPEYISIYFLKNNGQTNKITILKNGQEIWTVT